VDSTAGSVLLCFLDCYSGYHQIALHPDDDDKTAFITPHDIYCHKVTTFGLKNAEATYQKEIQKCLNTQIWKNVEAYVDDVVFKTTEEDKLIADLTETFANLREFQWKLNPTKCVFGVPSGLLLGFIVGHRGIEANPAKIDAIRKMAKPSNKKDVMKPSNNSDSNPASGYYSDSSYEFDFGSDPDEPEYETFTIEQPLSGPATGLVITSTPAKRFVYWPDRKPADLMDGNSRCVAYLDLLLFQGGTPLAPTEEHTQTEVATTDSSLGSPDRQVFMTTNETPGPSGT
jgi:hypothetical protein